MVEHNPAFEQFESLWKEAKNPQNDFQPVRVDGGTRELSVLSLLKQFTLLADCLDSSNAISADQHQQMHTAISNLGSVLQAVDPEKLSEALQSSKAI